MAFLEGNTKIAAIVAVSVIAGGALAAVVMTGAIPRLFSTTPPAASTASESTPMTRSAPIHKREAVRAHHVPAGSSASAEATPPPPPSASSCTNCGVVEGIDSYTEKGPASGGGAITGGLLGAIVGHQIGNGQGKELATVAGAVGGAFAGNAIEKNANKVTRYRVSVRMSDGTQRLFTLNSPPSLAVGDHAVIVNGVPERE
ncbi:MAG: outer membrane lipoprotein [Sulfuricaulis sp.]